MKTTIEVIANYSKRTFTIRRKENGKTYSKFRTLPMSKQEFEETDSTMTESDWISFLIFETGSYYKVK